MKLTINRFFTGMVTQFNRVDRKIRKFAMLSMLILPGMNFTGNLSAQSTIGFHSIGLIGMPDTVAQTDVWLVGAYIQNFSPSDSLQGDTVWVEGTVDSLSGIPSQYTSPSAVISLGPSDTMFFILPIDFANVNGFRIGNNVIVVWPMTTNPLFDPADSITVNVFVLDGVSTGPDPEAGEVRCFPVPASGPLYVTSSNRHLVVKEITVRDASGKIVAVSDNPATGIVTDDWAAGIYMLEIIFENGKRSVYKIIR